MKSNDNLKVSFHVQFEQIKETVDVIEFAREATVLQLKFILEKLSGIPSYLIRLFYFDECELVDDCRLSFYDVLPDAFLQGRVWQLWQPFLLAVKKSDVKKTIEMVVSANPGRYDSEAAYVAAFMAACRGHHELLENILNRFTVDGRCRLTSGRCLIDIAVERGQLKCVEILLGRKVRHHEWVQERRTLVNWEVQDKIRRDIERIQRQIKPISDEDQYTRLTNAQKIDSSLKTSLKGCEQRIYLCEIIATDCLRPKHRSTNMKDNHRKPTFKP